MSIRLLEDGFELELPLRTVSEPNVHRGWRERAKRTRTLRGVVGLVVGPHRARAAFPVVVRLERRSPGTLDDDNLRGALKAVRDGVADGLGIRDDSDPRLAWVYAQARAPKHGVIIQVRSAGEKHER